MGGPRRGVRGGSTRVRSQPRLHQRMLPLRVEAVHWQVCQGFPTVALSTTQTGTAGLPGSGGWGSPYTDSTGKWNSKYNLKVEWHGGQNYYPDYAIPSLSATNPGLVLDIGYNTTTTVTFTFAQPVSSVALDIYDISRSINSDTLLRYTDTVSFS